LLNPKPYACNAQLAGFMSKLYNEAVESKKLEGRSLKKIIIKEFLNLMKKLM